MPQVYNPIVRTFCQLRTALLNSADLDRREVRPDAPLASLLPPARRRVFCRELQRQGLRPPPLVLSERDRRRGLLAVLKVAASTAVTLQRWTILLLVLPLGLVAYWASRRRAVHFPLGLRTVGELVIYLTCFRDHKGSGYRWTRNEIALKVRLIIAESLGLPLEAVRMESTWAELGAD